MAGGKTPWDKVAPCWQRAIPREVTTHSSQGWGTPLGKAGRMGTNGDQHVRSYTVRARKPRETQSPISPGEMFRLSQSHSGIHTPCSVGWPQAFFFPWVIL